MIILPLIGNANSLKKFSCSFENSRCICIRFHAFNTFDVFLTFYCVNFDVSNFSYALRWLLTLEVLFTFTSTFFNTSRTRWWRSVNWYLQAIYSSLLYLRKKNEYRNIAWLRYNLRLFTIIIALRFFTFHTNISINLR